MQRNRRLGVLAALASLFVCGAAQAYHFTPTETEWASWPGYCKARYITTNIGGRSQYVSQVPRSEIDLWKQRIGDETFLNVHHYCASMASRMRAQAEPNKKEKAGYLRYALDNAMYSYVRTPTSSPVFINMTTNLALIEYGLGHTDSAVSYANKGVEAQPESAEAYVALAYVYSQMKKKEEARDVLVKGNTAVEGKSAEIHYNLGLLELELGDTDSAVTHAKEAYALGHPLPGLKRKLIQAKVWNDSE
jgi:tetratricopeptide (TPR) repeat protein